MFFENCTIVRLNEKNLAGFHSQMIFDAISGEDNAISMKTPQEFFFFKSDYYYAGEVSRLKVAVMPKANKTGCKT
jgi:hypothetical protein